MIPRTRTRSALLTAILILIAGSAMPACQGINIGMIETGGPWLWTYERLDSLGFDVSPLSPDSGLSVFRQYDVVLLPVSWAQADDGVYDAVEAHAADYLAYVQEGGGLVVEQPNPYRQPHGRVTPTLLPYPMTFYYANEYYDYPPIVVDPKPSHYSGP